jgi:hypothetical protein
MTRGPGRGPPTRPVPARRAEAGRATAPPSDAVNLLVAVQGSGRAVGRPAPGVTAIVGGPAAATHPGARWMQRARRARGPRRAGTAGPALVARRAPAARRSRRCGIALPGDRARRPGPPRGSFGLALAARLGRGAALASARSPGVSPGHAATRPRRPRISRRLVPRPPGLPGAVGGGIGSWAAVIRPCAISSGAISSGAVRSGAAGPDTVGSRATRPGLVRSRQSGVATATRRPVLVARVVSHRFAASAGRPWCPRRRSPGRQAPRAGGPIPPSLARRGPTPGNRAVPGPRDRGRPAPRAARR